MDLNYLYILLPIICWPLATVLLTKFSRNKWSLQTVLYRQITIFLVWIPLLFLISKTDILLIQENLLSVFLASFFWSIYIFSVFMAFDYLPIWISRVFTITSRLLLSLFIWYFVLFENIWLIDLLWLIVLLLWFYLLSKDKINNLHLKKKNIFFWIIISLANWILFGLSIYFFKIYSSGVNPLVSAYILESIDIILLSIFALIFSIKNNKNYFKIGKNDFIKILLISPIALLWTYWLAKSYDYISFYIINILFVFIFFSSLILAYFILWEKITRKQLLSMFIIMLTTSIIILF
jgi:hypothetical protein